MYFQLVKFLDADLKKNVDATGEISVCSLFHRDKVRCPSAKELWDTEWKRNTAPRQTIRACACWKAGELSSIESAVTVIISDLLTGCVVKSESAVTVIIIDLLTGCVVKSKSAVTVIISCVDYKDEETDCFSYIFEVDLNLDTYKPSISNRLISLTDPMYKQLTPFVSKSSQMRLGLPSTAVVGDRFGVSDRAVAAIASSVLHDVGLITSNNSDLVVDNNKLGREKA
ncbi:hypothetical protein AVEN_274436-1 [Araneus ventricosus]|uniref:Uncharacterized protein n=1 Tax=Araneus ventricosus TaxID=182803 RepID=A0A4Y2F6T6_ARAVE|nr:hypothetical protein AVEN_274436-1 [Araneus ventricosus]